MSPSIPLARPSIGEAEVAAVTRVLHSGHLAHGAEGHAFEHEFAARIGVRHAVALNSCASALQLALQAGGRQGEVILPSFTFIASANAVIAAGCTPVFAEVEEETGTLDPERIEALVTPRTVAVMPVHFAGQCCRMQRIVSVAHRHGLVVVEDSAEAIGAKVHGREAGSFGVGCFSFFPTKNLTTGEGGMLTTDDDTFAARARALRGHGVERESSRVEWPLPWHRVASIPGYNFRLTDLQAALGRVQLARLDTMNEARRAHAAFLNGELAELPGVALPRELPGHHHVYQMYTLQLDPQRLDRDRFVWHLNEAGIAASVHFDPPLHRQICFAGRAAGRGSPDLAVTERLSRSILTLPMYPDLTSAELERIAAAVRDAATAARA